MIDAVGVLNGPAVPGSSPRDEFRLVPVLRRGVLQSCFSFAQAAKRADASYQAGERQPLAL
jgi:hypothetical protein